MPSLSKDTALLLFCCFRQADRSVHYALSCPSQWPQFVAYYDDVKRNRIRVALGLLKDAGADTRSSRPGELDETGGLREIPRLLAGYFFNPLKQTWSFSVQQLTFFSVTLGSLLDVLGDPERRANEELIKLRGDCFQCHYCIGRKMIGLREIRKADGIEHFNQSDFTTHVTFADVGIRPL